MGEQLNFWGASVDEMKRGYCYDEKEGIYTCLICAARFEEGAVYPIGKELYLARRAVQKHVENEHGSPFEHYLEMGKEYTGFTQRQTELLRLFYKGCSDREIVERTDANNPSTIRSQRFMFRERYKQAKLVVAIMELMEERMADYRQTSARLKEETLMDIHKTATMVDERYAITQAERDEVIGRYFDSENNLVIKNFPVKQKKKLIILQHIMKEFAPGCRYTEKEVNAILKRFYEEDYVSIRRYMIEYGFLDRFADGNAYWVK